MILLALGPMLLAFGWIEWPPYYHARVSVAQRQSELAMAKSRNNGSSAALAGIRHATLRLAREEAAARDESIIYRALFPALE